MIHEKTTLREDQPAILYFSKEDGKDVPELLLFEEKLIRGSNWKRASERGRQLWLRVRDMYEQYTMDFFATDRFVRRLRYFKKITVLLNQPIDPAEVKRRLKRIVRDRSYHHFRWMIVDVLLLPLAVFTIPIPGPNFLGYYLLFRIFSHWKSYRSASNTHLDDVEVQVSSHAKEVSAFFQAAKDIKTGLHELRKKYGLRALQEHKFIPQNAKLRLMLTTWKRRFHLEHVDSQAD